jgi:hypothetical protein
LFISIFSDFCINAYTACSSPFVYSNIVCTPCNILVIYTSCIFGKVLWPICLVLLKYYEICYNLI